MKDNEQFGLLVADDEVVDGYLTTRLGEATSVALRSNKAFMLQAIEVRPENLLCAATKELRRDFDLVVAASSGHDSDFTKDLLYEYLDEDDDNFEILRNIRKQAEEKVGAYDGITKALNFGMSDHCGPDCPLQMLVIDAATTVGFKKKIAEFLGMPSSKAASELRLAAQNLMCVSISGLRDANW